MGASNEHYNDQQGSLLVLITWMKLILESKAMIRMFSFSIHYQLRHKLIPAISSTQNTGTKNSDHRSRLGSYGEDASMASSVTPSLSRLNSDRASSRGFIRLSYYITAKFIRLLARGMHPLVLHCSFRHGTSIAASPMPSSSTRSSVDFLLSHSIS